MSNIAPIMRRRFAILAILVTAAALLVAGCGNYTEENVTPTPVTVAETAPDRFAEDEAKAEGDGHGGAAAEDKATTEETTTAEDTTAEEPATTGEGAAEEPAAEGEGAAAADPAEGKSIFASSGCAACHTLADAGAAGVVGPNLDEVKPTVEAATEIITNGKGAMPAFKGQLSDEQIANVAAYIAQATQG